MKQLTKEQIDSRVAGMKSLCADGKKDVRELLYEMYEVPQTSIPKLGNLYRFQLFSDKRWYYRIIVDAGYYNGVRHYAAVCPLTGGAGSGPVTSLDKLEIKSNDYQFVANDLTSYLAAGGKFD